MTDTANHRPVAPGITKISQLPTATYRGRQVHMDTFFTDYRDNPNGVEMVMVRQCGDHDGRWIDYSAPVSALTNRTDQAATLDLLAAGADLISALRERVAAMGDANTGPA